MFGFDERFAMFDITPVENQFILEYLPDAKGDYVRVYLYGLMLCHHPENALTLNRMSQELNMSEEDICSAFRYWERRGLVRRISDQPLKWVYLSTRQVDRADPPDPGFESFCNDIYASFDKVRRLHGSELSTIFEWHEAMKLPTEVIIMLLHHMVEVKGKNFRISDAEKTAVRMVGEGILTTDAAEEFFSRDESVYNGIRKVLKLLGKRNLPSEPQINMYRKWVRDWHFSPQAIEAAVELTVRGEPTLPYLDGILKSLKEEFGDGQDVTPDTIRISDQRSDQLRQVLKALGQGTVNSQTLSLFDKMRVLYPMEVILTGARECRNSRKGAEDLLKLLEAWRKKGLNNPEQVNEYVRHFHDQTDLIRQIRSNWGLDPARISRSDRDFLVRWEEELGFSRDMILYASAFASEANQPMSYLGKILDGYYEKGIHTREEAEKDHAGKPSRSAGQRGVLAQQYAQRDYSGVQKQLIDEQNREMDEFMQKNGGESDA